MLQDNLLSLTQTNTLLEFTVRHTSVFRLDSSAATEDEPIHTSAFCPGLMEDQELPYSGSYGNQ